MELFKYSWEGFTRGVRVRLDEVVASYFCSMLGGHDTDLGAFLGMGIGGPSASCAYDAVVDVMLDTFLFSFASEALCAFCTVQFILLWTLPQLQ
ncbi:hypothetical protein VNO77_16882 [Canavalia gladiata]|uniref:Uncharacterized protein n=1 Tax=Canavalia gladiata TaxID=3824 RepID=A0AAN9LI32_CANGL